MLALVCTLVFAAAATFAVAAIFVTMQGRKAQIAGLLAEYRSLERDREFLVQITSHAAEANRSFTSPQLRRSARRLFRQAEAARSARSLRAAA
jgi:predicted hotdog family 3-hydroxylacyl-ACP dehydratase